jgi:flagellar biosynthesis regulator FlbT
MAVSPDLYVMLIPEKGRELCARFFASRIAAGLGCDSTAEIIGEIQSVEVD